MSDKYMKLVVRHAFYADEVRRLRSLGSEASGNCARWEKARSAHPFGPMPSTCIEEVIQGVRDASHPLYGEQQDFEEEWGIAVADGDVCDQCIAVREYKKQRKVASRKLAATRAAMTRVGRAVLQIMKEKEMGE